MIEAIALLIGGIIIIIFENHQSKLVETPEQNDLEKMTFKQLITLGIAQSLAVIPGVSRSGAVIISGRALGLGRSLITEFSFLLAVPTMLAATVYDIYKSGFSFSSSEWGTISSGFIVSFITAFLVIGWLNKYVKTHTFKVFGWYRIILGFLLIIALFFGVL